MHTRARWLVLLPLVLALLGLTASALAGRPAQRQVAFLMADLPAVSRHAVPAGSFWLVRTGAGWRAYADQGSGWRNCPLQWEQDAQRFTDLCGVGVWDRFGRVLGGAGVRNLDEFAVTVGSPEGYVTVDLSRPAPGALSPMQVLYAYVADLELGQREQAWQLIHPDRRNEAAYRQFLAAGGGALREQGIEGQKRLPTWDDQLKQHGMAGGRTWEQVMELNVIWENGERQTIHFVLDDQGAWRLLWSPAFALE